jgi:hypothetical protein
MAKILRCSFCNKSEDEVAKLVAGPKVYICDACVQIAMEIMEHGGPGARRQGLMRRLWNRIFSGSSRRSPLPPPCTAPSL